MKKSKAEPVADMTEADCLKHDLCRCGTVKEAIDEAARIVRELNNSDHCVIWGAVVTHFVEQIHANMIRFGEISEHGPVAGVLSSDYMVQRYHETAGQISEVCGEYLRDRVVSILEPDPNQRGEGDTLN